MNGERNRIWLWLLAGTAGFCLFIVALFLVIYVALREESDSGFALGDKIAIVDVEGVIIESRTIVDQLKEHGDDDSVKAIILRINTPGGGAAASQEIYQAVRRIRDKKKKRIVASIETVGASGGYYIAAGANKIYANPASVVGSIGVIAEWINYEELLKWAKLKDVTMKAGELKDAGSPAREMTPAEREYLQSIIDDMHAQFIRDVADGRGLKLEEVQPIATGRVWTGQQALPLKLIDSTADLQTAVDETAKAVGIKGEPHLLEYEEEERTLLDILFEDISDIVPTRAKLLEKNVGFYYLWR